MDYALVDEKEEKIVFLYKLVEGICEKSFAFNVARMAGIPKDIVKNAQSITKMYRETSHI